MEKPEQPKQLRLFGSRINAERNKLQPDAPREFRLPIAIEIIPLEVPQASPDNFIDDLAPPINNVIEVNFRKEEPPDDAA